MGGVIVFVIKNNIFFLLQKRKIFYVKQNICIEERREIFKRTENTQL